MITTFLHRYLLPALVIFSAVTTSMAQQQQIAENEQVKARTAYIDGLAAFENEEYQKVLQYFYLHTFA